MKYALLKLHMDPDLYPVPEAVFLIPHSPVSNHRHLSEYFPSCFQYYVRFAAVIFSVCDNLGVDTTESFSMSILSDSAFWFSSLKSAHSLFVPSNVLVWDDELTLD